MITAPFPKWPSIPTGPAPGSGTRNEWVHVGWRKIQTGELFTTLEIPGPKMLAATKLNDREWEPVYALRRGKV